MTVKFAKRADARALTGGLFAGAAVGLLIGGFYVAGSVARASDSSPNSVRLANAAALGFSEDALKAETAAMEPGALALAQLHDPASEAQAGLRMAEAPNDTPAATGRPQIMRASYLTGPAAQPFHFADPGALQSARDLDCLTDAVYYEARGETPAGQAAVAQVVLNRVRHPAFPKTVCGVVFQGVGDEGCQFSFACDGSMRRPREAAAWRRAAEISARALAGVVMPAVGNATHFHVIGLNPEWGPRLLKVAQIGLHVFYRFGGSAGAPSHFNGAAIPSPTEPSAAPAELQTATADGHAAAPIVLAANATLAPGASASAPTEAVAVSVKPAADAAKADAGAADKAKADTAGAKAS